MTNQKEHDYHTFTSKECGYNITTKMYEEFCECGAIRSIPMTLLQASKKIRTNLKVLP